MFSILSAPFEDWIDRPSNRFGRTLIETAPEGSSYVVTLVPVTMPPKKVLDVLGTEIPTHLGDRSLLSMVDFPEAFPIASIYRGSVSNGRDGSIGLVLPFEERFFHGLHLSIVSSVGNSEVQAAKDRHRKFIAQLRLSVFNISMEAIVLESVIDVSGKILGPALASSEIVAPDFSEDAFRLPFSEALSLLNASAVESVEAAAAATTFQSRFTFLWMAIEFAIGDSAARREFVDRCESKIVKEQFEWLRKLRASIMKVNESFVPFGYEDTLMLFLLRAHMIDDPCALKEYVAKIEQFVEKRTQSS